MSHGLSLLGLNLLFNKFKKNDEKNNLVQNDEKNNLVQNDEKKNLVHKGIMLLACAATNVARLVLVGFELII